MTPASSIRRMRSATAGGVRPTRRPSSEYDRRALSCSSLTRRFPISSNCSSGSKAISLPLLAFASELPVTFSNLPSMASRPFRIMDGMQTPGKLAARARQSSQRTSVGGISVGVWAALISVYIVWGSTYLAIREAVRTMPPFLMASARFLVAGGLLYAFAIGRGDRTGDKPGGRQWLAVTVVGGMLLLGGNGGVVWAEQHIPSGIAALLIATVPLWMVLVGAGLFGSRVTRREVLGVLV